MWLRDALPHHVKNLKVITYGYDSKMEHSLNTQSLDDIANEFVGRLRSIRAHGEVSRSSASDQCICARKPLLNASCLANAKANNLPGT
jgi:hypothetical protein